MRWSYFKVGCPSHCFMRDFTWDKITVRAICVCGGGMHWFWELLGWLERIIAWETRPSHPQLPVIQPRALRTNFCPFKVWFVPGDHLPQAIVMVMEQAVAWPPHQLPEDPAFNGGAWAAVSWRGCWSAETLQPVQCWPGGEQPPFSYPLPIGHSPSLEYSF